MPCHSLYIHRYVEGALNKPLLVRNLPDSNYNKGQCMPTRLEGRGRTENGGTFADDALLLVTCRGFVEQCYQCFEHLSTASELCGNIRTVLAVSEKAGEGREETTIYVNIS